MKARVQSTLPGSRAQTRVVACSGATDKRVHGYASDIAALPLCKKKVKRDPTHNRAEACEECLPLIAKRLGTTVSNVLEMLGLPANSGTVLSDGRQS